MGKRRKNKKTEKRKKEERRKGKYGGEEKIKDTDKGIKGGKLSEVCFLWLWILIMEY